MASLIFAKNFFNSVPINIFKKAATNSEIIIGGVGKFAFEHQLIANETFIYSVGLVATNYNYLADGVLFAGGIGSFIIPGFRLYKSWENKAIDIINCENR